mmetsp:Transcript_66233/g.92136  ORF Transcript_66233/g.92136 Transcript_66233/m.92136 type:complete len:87 (-) Transcript_66233:259-519(-)
MNKTEILSGSSANTSNSSVDFFYGFASVFGLESNAKSLVECEEKDDNEFEDEIQIIVKDLKAGNFSGAIQEGLELIKTFRNASEDC